MKNILNKIAKGFTLLISGTVVTLSGVALILWVNSPGETDPITGSDGNILPGSIATIEKIHLGGEDQFLIIRGSDTTRPVMLFLHGGPGSPEYAFMKKYNRALENEFVMVYWEQRGAGKSYSKQIPVEKMNLAQFISDTRELSEILAKRFGKKKIYLMGHSWGSLLGILTAYRNPELFHAFLGCGQVCNQYKGEKVSFEWVRKQAAVHNDMAIITKLSVINFPDSLASNDVWLDFLGTERKFVNRYGGGITHNLTGMWPAIKILFKTKEYTFREKLNYMPANMFSLKHLWAEVMNINVSAEIDSMQIPVYIFQGKYDYQTPCTVAKEFFDQLKAPHKAFFTFNSSAHSPIFEETERFNSIIRKYVLKNQ